jgi:hypothetical protein
VASSKSTLKVVCAKPEGAAWDVLIEMEDGARFSFLMVPVHDGLDATSDQVNSAMAEVADVLRKAFGK